MVITRKLINNSYFTKKFQTTLRYIRDLLIEVLHLYFPMCISIYLNIQTLTPLGVVLRSKKYGKSAVQMDLFQKSIL